MDLIEAMEMQEARAPAALRPPPPPQSVRARAPAAKAAPYDIVLQQAAFVQTRLKALWAAKHQCVSTNTSSSKSSNGTSAADVCVPFSWVLSKVPIDRSHTLMQATSHTRTHLICCS